MGDESTVTWAESQWIVVAKPLCHVQYPVVNLSCLQRILPIIRLKLQLKAFTQVMYKTRVEETYITPLGSYSPTIGHGANERLMRCIFSLDSDLEAFSHNPTHGSFARLAFQLSAMTNCLNQRFLSY
ncbi:hypothetical protein KSP40_PGU002636 [Platanthera guangdongensis]|uniref:Uncharacterized protein n=1 Tax=Platanthera guangdongensis TaxID=2320717 RepID=A0ABR2LYK4_9ASPA